MTRTFRRALPAVALLAAAGAGVLVAGPLTPPAGPITSTYKTLSEVEPRTAISSLPLVISQPGSYYLTQNLVIPPSQVGISINASNVTLDLRGFTLQGNGTSSDAITVWSSSAGVTIRNGAINNINGHGIYAAAGAADLAPGMTVEDVRVTSVAGRGISCSRGATINRCYVNAAEFGIRSGYSSKVLDSTVEFARHTAFNIEGGSTVANCVSAGTGGTTGGGHAFVLGAGSTATNCVARSNQGAGFTTLSQCLLQGCSSTNNNGGGFILGTDDRMETCSAIGNTGAGVMTASGAGRCEITRCSISVIGSSGVGIDLTGNAYSVRITDSSIRGSSVIGQIGIRVNATATDCTIARNQIGFLGRGVELDGLYNIVINNTFQFVNQLQFITDSNGAAPHPSNSVGPVAQTVAGATNPLLNLAQ